MKHSNKIILAHWLTILLFILLFLTNSCREWAEKGSDWRAVWLNLHAWLGIGVLLLSCIRLISRLTTSKITSVYNSKFMHTLHAIMQVVFYILLFIVPICGYLRFSSRGHMLTLAGQSVPSLIEKSDWLHALGKLGHGEIMQGVVLTVIGIHIFAALYHQFIKKDNIMARICR
ncbi:cytochrome b [Vibrio artabrorum]|uniref:cytochrome b n=1 Tax=Vibrio artabrorum TaxID=446374 RepID=UPI00354EDBE0